MTQTIILPGPPKDPMPQHLIDYMEVRIRIDLNRALGCFPGTSAAGGTTYPPKEISRKGYFSRLADGV